MFCPNCTGEIADDANFCEKCGLKMGEQKITQKTPQEHTNDLIGEASPEEIEVELVDKETAKKPCEMCGDGELELVSEKEKPPLYRCSNCGNYFGNFMRKGVDIYYDTTHLRIGQYIASQLIHGKYHVSVHKKQREKGVEEVADRIRKDIPLDRKKIADALSYLIEKNVLYTYNEPTPDGEFEWFGVEFANKTPEDTEITP